LENICGSASLYAETLWGDREYTITAHIIGSDHEKDRRNPKFHQKREVDLSGSQASLIGMADVHPYLSIE
jgi:hypothetical protein